MPSIHRIRAVWTGLPAGSAVSTFYAGGGTVPNLAALQAGMANLAALIPAIVKITIENQGDTIDDATGVLSGNWSTAAVAAIQGTGTGGYGAAQGARVKWLTEGIHNGRRLRGRTFVVPIIGGFYGANGRLLAGAVTNLQGLVNGVVGAGTNKYVVWGRPTVPKNPDGSAIEGAVPSGGMSSPITAGVADDFMAVLRSRRD